MIIGISGKIGSGKDTFAKMLMEEITRRTSPRADLSTLNLLSLQHLSGFKIKKFAGKLKEMVCLLTGCTMEQLEDQQFKLQELGSEWNRTPREAKEWLIMTGKLGDNYNADESEITAIAKASGFKFTRTYREMLQELGTNVFREHFHPQVWVNALLSEYKPGPVTDIKGWGKPKGNLVVDEYPKWLITDVRFPEEAEAIKSKSGSKLIRINRTSATIQSHEIATHPSEVSLDKYQGFDEVIDNNHSLEDLRKIVNGIVNKFNL